MKRQLRHIYDDLANGRLSQREALEKIRAIKLQGAPTGAMLFTPVWQAGGADADPADYAEHHVIRCEPWAPDEQTVAERYSAFAVSCFEKIQAILRGKPQGRVLVQIAVADPRFAGLAGLLKTAAHENPQFAGQLIVVPADITEEELRQGLDDEKRRGADVVRYEAGVRQVLRWQEVTAGAEEPPIAFRDGGVYLITGGLGGVGTLFAKEILARTRDARVILTGRSAGKPAVDGVSYRQVDVRDLHQVEQLIAAIRSEHGRLDGILHAAGVLADDFILKKSGRQFAEVLGPKVAGTWNLDQATRDVELDFFVLFSSIAGPLGNVGQADYATANAFLDQFAAHRNRQVANGQRRGRTRSINWPWWEAGGMVLDDASRERFLRTTGIQPMQTATGMAAFHRSLACPHDQILVAEGDLAQMRVALVSGRPIEPEVAAAPKETVALDRDSLVEKTEDYLRRELSDVLKLPAQKIDPQAALEKYGIDSILAMKLTSQLEKTFGSLSKTLFFEYQTIRELTQYFVEAHAERLAAILDRSAGVPPASRGSSRAAVTAGRDAQRLAGETPALHRKRRSRGVASATPDDDPIAIIGLSGRYPEAENLEAYWRNLREGKDCVVEVPKDRWDWREYFTEDRTKAGHHYSKWGGFIAGVDEFDPLFFNISPKEAKFIDPQERLFLQHAWQAIEDAGYTRAGLQIAHEGDLAGQVGVYAGVMYNEYQLFGGGIAASVASIANRVSYVLNLHGPSMTLDTMCSSSLTAIHLACQDLKQGRTNLAIAGGVNVTVHPNKYLALSTGQFISSDGHCQSFGEGGDGYIPGEGVGVVILKRLSEAERDGDHIYGIIRGSALNHGGKTNGYTVPNPQAQASAISRALTESGIDARHVSYIEAHGTGTKLGDPIEIAALSKAFQQHTQDAQFCLIGSAKSNIGHCESAAGIAGLTKVLLQMQHREIVPSLHSAQLNPHIDFAKGPFIVNQALRPWEQPVIEGRKLPRIAGLSSFGAGGSNAHLLIEEYVAPAQQPMTAEPVAILLSARTPEQLQQKVRELIDFVRGRNLDLASIAYTLQVGREAMDERLGLVVSSVEELIERLQSLEDVHRGQVKRGSEALSLFGSDADLRETVEKWIASGKLSKLVELWVKGLDVDWTKLHSDVRPRRIALPAYPFARERHWVDVAAAAKTTATAVLHPLLHANTSDLNETRYSSTFRGDEPFITDKVLQRDACLEMARAAIERALPERPSFELCDVVWLQPIVIAENQPIHIALHANSDEEIEFEIYGDDETVYCQGRAVLGDEPLPEAPRPQMVEPKEIAFTVSQQTPQKKRTTISLEEPGAATGNGQPATPRKPLTLASTAPSAIHLYDRGNGVFAIRIDASGSDVADQLRGALEKAQQEASLKVLLIHGAEHCADDETILSFPYPVIAVLQRDTSRCDFTVRSEAHAEQLAARLASKSRDALRLLKQHLVRQMLDGAAVARIASPWTELPATRSASYDGAPTPIPLRSRVVTAVAYPGGIVVVKMEDRDAKNMFSEAFMEGVAEAFAHIESTPSYKVVVLTGYDHYFASGGTKESLLAIQAGKVKFTDSNVFRLPLECKLPVVAAMQGHGIGAGWCLGMFADVVLMSEESRYVSPYMTYGFTPGAGATLILPEKLGQGLARESLLTGEPFTGRELKERGLRLPVLPRNEVYPAAMAMAQRIAQEPRPRLIELKQQSTAHIRERIEETLRRELAMHEQTFVGQSATLAQIESNFHQEAAPPVQPASSHEEGDLSADVSATLRTLLAAELQMRESDIDDHTQFVDLGLDSISGVSWIRKINEKYQTSIEATKVYSHPTLTELSRFVKAEAEASGSLSMPVAPAPAPERSAGIARTERPGGTPVRRRARRPRAHVASAPAHEPIAVIGMAGQFPQASDVDQFWRNIAEGKNCIAEVPRERWDVDAYYQAGDAAPGKTYARWLGALDEYDRFDPRFFNISPTEAESMDPQQRLFLQACWQSIENAGYDARALSGRKCGVFVGCAAGDYHQLSRRHRLSAHGFTGGATSILASRISYFLNLQGPCVSIDTACSSSLVAIAQACDSLNSGDSELAMAGGVYVMAGPEMLIRTSQAAMLSPEGRCFTFDQRADGFVPGEGVGVVVLKRLSDAERDGDVIHGVIHGWGVNQDGKTNGITAPNPESQTRLMQDVYDKYRIDPAKIQLLEAHGTGTKLGDPIEVEGLKASFQKYTQNQDYCALGSVKSNIGHCLTAAGVAGVIKLLQALKHKQLPPTINFERLNEHIDLKGTPFYVNTRLQEWKVSGAERRQAAISSFGFSGTNAHLVIGESNQTAPAVAPSGKVLIPLSARTPEQLRQRAEDLLTFVRQERVDLAALAYTLQVGRAAMDERLGFIVSSVEQLAERLQAWLAGRQGFEDVYQGHAKRNKEALSLFVSDPDLQQTIGTWIANRKLVRLLDLWVKGLEIDWSKLHGDSKPRRISLPIYPFAKERYWIDGELALSEVEGPAPQKSAYRRGLVRRRLAGGKKRTAAGPAADQPARPPALLAIPIWQSSDEPEEAIEYAERHVILCETTDEQKNIAQRYTDHALACFERIQTILRSKPQGKVLVQIVVDDPRLAGLSALLQTAALESPQLTGQLILGGKRQVLRWQEVAAGAAPVAFKDGGVYLITGGTGGLGLLFAREILARTRDARVILTGRSARPAPADDRMSYRQVDLADLAQVERLIAGIREDHGRLDGILHCAGMNADNVIVKKTAAEFRAVLEPKVLGTFHLDEATRDVELDFFVLFSSIAGALGNLGQADYAAANAFMDHFAAHRNRERHGRTRSINWPLWQEGGMAIDRASQEMVRQTIGAVPMQTATGLEAFHQALSLPHAQLLVVEGDKQKINAYLQPPARRPFDFAQGKLAGPAAVTLTDLQDQLKAILATVLRIDASTIDLDQPFIDLGLDSFLGAELIVAINKRYDTQLSHLRLFDYSTVRELSQFLEKELPLSPASVEAPPPPVREAAAPKKRRPLRRTSRQAKPDDRIAIIGMSGRYPEANDLNQYWSNLIEGRNSVTEVPRSRWDVDRYYDPDRTRKDKTYSKWLGAIDGIEYFDPLFFRISPQEAEYMDPQHRLFLQESYKAFEDAGYSTATLSNQKCGVYLGISTNEYMTLLSRHGVLSAPVTSNSYAIAAARIAYYLNLKGPAISVDTACSSSLVAVHLACQAIRNGEIDMALAGGVSLWLTPDSYVAMSKAGMFSPDGQCKTFDDSANGIVNGEGVGALVLKRLRDAQRDGDVIYGVILGSGINQDGRTNGITAPSVNSQIELERAVYARHGIEPDSISYVEAHGTGTKLGDPIELEALATVFKEKTSRKNFCALGSVKSNIGHTTSAAGVAGLHKVLLAMRHRTLVPSLSVTRENSRFDFASSPFYINRETKSWEVPAGTPRRAAVSSFGFSGTNAHLVVEEYSPNQAAPLAGDGTVIVPLSARTTEQLRQKAQDLLDFLRSAQQPVDLAGVAYTLQVGRESMEERLGLVVSSADQLAEKLSAWLRGEKSIDGVRQGRVESGSDITAILGRDDDMQETIDRWVARRKLATLLELWIRGLNFDWNRLHRDAKPRRVSLPTYPFARERCWLDGTSVRQEPERPVPVTVNLRVIEDILDQIDDDKLETGHAVHALKQLV